jgi:cellulose synthase (UDP-forming)
MSPITTTILEGIRPGVFTGALVLAALPWLRRESAVARTLVIAVSIFLAWRYMLWRITDTLPPPGLTTDYITGALFALTEALALLSTSLSFLFLTRIRDRTKDVEANMVWLTQQPVLPRVDVLICNYNEEEAILEQTIVGALAMEYPKFLVWV